MGKYLKKIKVIDGTDDPYVADVEIKGYTRWMTKKVLCAKQGQEAMCNYCCAYPDGRSGRPWKEGDKPYADRAGWGKYIVVQDEEREVIKEKYNKDVDNIIKFKDDTSCNHLSTEVGCEFGEDRPIHCKLYPLEVNDDGKLVLGFSGFRKCPLPQNYTFVKEENGKYHYKLKRKGPFKKDVLILPKPIDDMVEPLYLWFESEIREAFGDEFYENMKNEIEYQEPTLEGFLHD